MRKLILYTIVMFNTSFLYAQTQQYNTDNIIKDLKSCEEFNYLSDVYQKKSMESNVYSDRYNLISQNFNLMYIECKNSVKKNNQYYGFRSNALQQRRQQRLE